MTDADAFWVAGAYPRASTANLMPGGILHFDLTSADNIVQADSATGTTAKLFGLTSGAVGATRSYTVKLDTIGTYYFCEHRTQSCSCPSFLPVVPVLPDSAKAPSYKRATVVVAEPVADSSSGGNDGSSSSGGNGGFSSSGSCVGNDCGAACVSAAPSAVVLFSLVLAALVRALHC
jgi:uncharacterized membrane protein YgcG